jgi:RHS repeat-associated protein
MQRKRLLGLVGRGIAMSFFMTDGIRKAVALFLVAVMFVSSETHAQAAVEYIHTDALGSPVAVTNQTGTVISKNDYEPYGALIGVPNYQGVGYTGHVQDAATNLTYMQQRFYDSTVGLFLSVDAVTADRVNGANFNRYWYANNNPYKFSDPDGRLACNGADRDCKSQIDELEKRGIFPLQEKSEKAKFSLRRHKTPASQARLIESVGGDVELLEYAQETHKEFAQTVISLAGGGGLFGGARSTPTTVIGRVKDLQKLGPNERSLLSRLPNLGSPRANWQQNAGVLRAEMRLGRPIRDASPGDTAGQFLNAERNLLRDRGWTFDPKTSFWMPPKP